MTNTLTLSVSFGSSVTVTLNEKSAEGYDCLSLIVPQKSKKAEMTFAPRAEWICLASCRYPQRAFGRGDCHSCL